MAISGIADRRRAAGGSASPTRSSVSRCSFASTPVRAGDVEDRIALVAEADAGVDGRQEAARPVGRAAADAAAGGHDDERRQVLRLGAQAVERPTSRGSAGRAARSRC